MEKTVEYTFKLEHWYLRVTRSEDENVVLLSIHWNNKDDTQYVTEVSLDDFRRMSKDLMGEE